MRGMGVTGSVLLAFAATAAHGAANDRRPADGWIAAYLSPLTLPGAAAPADRTVRQLIRLEAGGKRLRVLLSNELSPDPLAVDDARFALADAGGALVPVSDRPLTFAGARSVTLAPGEMRYSDPVDMALPARTLAAVSVHYPASSVVTGTSREGLLATGDHAADPAIPGDIRGRTGGVARVEVQPTAARRVLVAFGDSITAGYLATRGAHHSYPEQLTDLFATRPGGAAWSVVNAGISGNRVLRDRSGPCALARFDREALSVPGVAAVLVLEGVNDIGHSDAPANAAAPQPVTAAQLIGADRQLVARAHARGIRIYFGTVLPYRGAAYWAPAGEAKRVALNQWIRTNREADGYIDFAAAIADPAQPDTMRAEWQADHLHPNDAGYRVMAQAVTPAAMERSTARAAGVPVTAATCLTD